MRVHHLGSALVLCALGLLPRRAVVAQPAVTCVTLAVHHRAGQEAFVATQLAGVDSLFSPIGLRFHARMEIEAVPAVDTRHDRDQLGARVSRGREPSAVHVFVTPRLADVDAPGGERMGVHWRPRRDRLAHFVIVSERAWQTTLAHELGHYFGNPHSPTPNNIMSYARDGVTPPFWDARQIARIRSRVRGYTAAGLERQDPTRCPATADGASDG